MWFRVKPFENEWSSTRFGLVLVWVVLMLVWFGFDWSQLALVMFGTGLVAGCCWSGFVVGLLLVWPGFVPACFTGV